LSEQLGSKYGLWSCESKETSDSGTAASISPLLEADERVLIGILSGLAPLPAFFHDAETLLPRLAASYDRFLRRDIRRHGGYLVSVEETPAAMWGGSGHAVSEEIIGYVIRRSVEHCIAGKPPREIASLHILDPACGTGRFLLAAYLALLRYYEEWYCRHLVPLLENGNGPGDVNVRAFLPFLAQNVRPRDSQGMDPPAALPVARGSDGAWHLTFHERQRILLSHFFGLDPDPRAVEAARVILSLALLKAGGVPADEEAGALPPKLNILCGNALFSPRLFSIPEMMLVSAGDRAEIRAFDWECGFPDAMKAGGFDLIIGSPPAALPPLRKGQREYLQMQYSVYHGREDASPYFVELGLSLLLRKKGILLFALPDRWLRAGYAARLRNLLRTFQVEEIACHRELTAGAVCPGDHCVLTVSNMLPLHPLRLVDIAAVEAGIPDGEGARSLRWYDLAGLGAGGWVFDDTRQAALLGKIGKAGRPLGDYVRGGMYTGIPSGGYERTRHWGEHRQRTVIPGKAAVQRGEIIRYGPVQAEKHRGLSRTGRQRHRHAVHLHRDTEMFPHRERAGGRIILSPAVPRIACAFAQYGTHAVSSLFIIPTKSLYLLGILNSRLMSFALTAMREGKEEGSPMYSRAGIERISIYTIDFENPADRERHDKIVYYVNRMLELTKMLSRTEGGRERNEIGRQIAATDREIDLLVYDLYRLTDEEREMVDGATGHLP
jgi:SAM-dependent methyltransferase